MHTNCQLHICDNAMAPHDEKCAFIYRRHIVTLLTMNSLFSVLLISSYSVVSKGMDNNYFCDALYVTLIFVSFAFLFYSIVYWYNSYIEIGEEDAALVSCDRFLRIRRCRVCGIDEASSGAMSCAPFLRCVNYVVLTERNRLIQFGYVPASSGPHITQAAAFSRLSHGRRKGSAGS